MTQDWIRVVVPAEADVHAMITAFQSPAVQDRDYEIWLTAPHPTKVGMGEVLRAFRRGDKQGLMP